MQQLWFWNEWPRTAPKRLFAAFVILFLVTIMGVAYLWWQGSETAIRWYTEPELQPKRTVVEDFNQLSFDFTIDADSYIISERYRATDIVLDIFYARLYAALVIAGMVLLLTIATFLNRIPFAVICTIVVLQLATSGFDQMAIAGMTFSNIPLIISLALFLLPAYYFQEIAQQTPLVVRLTVFTALAVGTVALIGWQAETAHLLMQWTGYSYVIPMLLTALLIWFTGHELLGALFVFVSNLGTAASGNPIRHFAIIGGIYLFNIAYDYLLDVGMVDYKIFMVSPFVWFFINLLLGFWGLWRKEPAFVGIVPVAPYGYFGFLGLSFVALGFIGYAFATNNSSLLKALEDLIRYAQFGVGLIFYIYILANFTAPMRQGLPVHKVMYQGRMIAYGFVNLAALVVAGVMAANSDFFIFEQSKAGYFIYQGDMERAKGDPVMSEQNYKFALALDPYSHRGNYSVGSLARMQGDEATALFFFSRATFRNPNPADYVNIAELMTNNNRFLDGLFQLREGLKRFPQDGRLMNNMGLLYTKTDVVDSAFYYLKNAKEHLSHPEVAESNFYAMAVRYNFAGSTDTLRQMLNPRRWIGTTLNELALLNVLRQPTAEPLDEKFLPDSVLNTYELCYLYNYALNRIGDADTSIINILDKYAKVPANENFVPYLQLAKAMKLRRAGQYGRAYNILQKLQYESPSNNPYYANVLGMMALQVEEYSEAARHFEVSYRRGNAEAFLNRAIALTEVPARRAEALEAWQMLKESGNATYQTIARDILYVIHPDSVKKINISVLDDEGKMRFIHYNHGQLSDEAFNRLFQSLQSPIAQVQAAIERIRYYISEGNIEKATNIRNAMTGINVPDVLVQPLRDTDLRLLYAQGRYKEMGTVLKGYQPPLPLAGYQPFYEGMFAIGNNDLQKAETLLKEAIARLPQKQELYLELAALYNKRKEPQKAYDVLVDVLRTRDDYHDYPPAIYELYALQCLEIGLDNFADEAIVKLEDLISPQRYAKVVAIFNQRKAELAKQREENW
jgi:tetratricopeptide (TPR) repeat protein